MAEIEPERSCVCCRSRRRLGRLRARPAPHCNLDRVVFRYQNERRSRLLAASSYCATAIDLFGILPLRSCAVGRYGHGRTSRLPRRTLWVRFRFQSSVQGRGPLGLQYTGPPWRKDARDGVDGDKRTIGSWTQFRRPDALQRFDDLRSIPCHDEAILLCLGIGGCWISATGKCVR